MDGKAYEGIEKQMQRVCRRFGLGEYLRFQRLDGGHINDTYRVYVREYTHEKEYVLQKVNTFVFQNPTAVMENIAAVTNYLQMQGGGCIGLRYFATADGAYYLCDESGFWRCCLYIGNSVSYEHTDNLQIVEQSGKAFGSFARRLMDYPVHTLHIVIPHFHNTVRRYEALKQAEQSDTCDRRKQAVALLQGYYDLHESATKPYRMQRAGILPLRVTHNDTKLSNVLFDRRTNEYISVIDLDTVMPGLTAFDFGDAIRAGASTAGEDETDLGKVALDMEKYKAFTRGYIGALKGSVSAEELQCLSLGALAMTAECGVRFLTDYLQGDRYFRVGYPTQNFDRARCHLRLAQDMLAKQKDMQAIVNFYIKTVE